MSLPVLFTQVDWIILAVTAVVLLYMYVARYSGYWKKQNVPEEKLGLLVGPIIEMLSKPFHLRDEEKYRKYGKLFGIYEGGKPTLFVAEPDLVKQVLVKDFAMLPQRRRITFNDPILDNMMSVAEVDRWKKIRPASSPAFTAGRLRRMNALIEDCAQVMAQHLRNAAEKSEDIDIKQFFGHFTLDTIARCAFGMELDSCTDKANEFVSKVRQAFSQDLNLRIILLFFFPGIFKFFNMKAINMDVLEYFRSLSLHTIGERKAQNVRKEDFLQLMMDAHEGTLTDTEESASVKEAEVFSLGDEEQSKQPTGRKPLTEDEALAQCVLFFVAGQDVTSSVISHTVYLLALHPEVQAKLQQEVDQCFEEHGTRLSLDIVVKQKYLHAVVSESLRMFPVLTRIERSAIEDYTLGDTGITLPKDCVVAIPVYAMHHDPEYFPDPSTFDPERFSDENISNIRPYTYLPFGAGPRNCIAMRFGLHAVKLCVMHAVHNAEFVRTAQTKVPLQFCKGLGPMNAKDVTVGIRKRYGQQN